MIFKIRNWMNCAVGSQCMIFNIKFLYEKQTIFIISYMPSVYPHGVNLVAQNRLPCSTSLPRPKWSI